MIDIQLGIILQILIAHFTVYKMRLAKDSEIIQLAEDIIEFHYEYSDECQRWGYYCMFCDSSDELYENPKDIKHSKDCSVLIAKRILKKSKNGE